MLLFLFSAFAAVASSGFAQQPFVLFASYALVGHTTPLVNQAAELARLGVAGRIVVANTAFIGSPQPELSRMFTEPTGEAYGLGIEFVEVGFVNETGKRLGRGDFFSETDSVRALFCLIRPCRLTYNQCLLHLFGSGSLQACVWLETRFGFALPSCTMAWWLRSVWEHRGQTSLFVTTSV
jgi:hypothetical protein